MLQRAASNAYSWWWASHIRTKQGKWLEQSLQDMEDRVKHILQIIEEDADSFAKRAEMYYKKRPELINFVEESYRAYRALAERYEKISGELQNANHTIANVCPEQVEFAMEDDGDDDQDQPPRPPSSDDDQENPPKPPLPDPSKIPKPLPEHLKFNFKGNALRKHPKHAMPPKPKKPQSTASSQKNSKEAQERIDKLQKEILVLQTEKEFVTSSYESAMEKCWEIEKQITEMQEEICSLQDEFSVETVIEDNEARALMTAMALKSCKDTLVQLRDKQKKFVGEAKVESKRVRDAEEMLKALKEGRSPKDQTEKMKLSDSPIENFDEEFSSLNQEGLVLQSICEKIKEYFEMNSNTARIVTELAESVDELVTKVLGLETALSSQTALVERLRLEADELHNHLKSLEEDRAALTKSSKDRSGKIKELEGELHRVKGLNQSVEARNVELRMSLMEACHNFGDLFKKIQSPRQKDEAEAMDASGANERALLEEGFLQGEGLRKEQTEEEEELPDLRQLLSDGLEDKEKVILKEYTSILRNYKETKKRLSEMEKKNKETVAMKDAEIQSLKHKLSDHQGGSDGESDTHLKEPRDSTENESKSSENDAKITGHKQWKALEELLYERHSDYYAPKLDESSISILEEDIKVAAEEEHALSTVEEKFRKDLDELLEENLQFWLKFTSSYHQIQIFQKIVTELQSEVQRLRKDNKKHDSNANASNPLDTKAEAISKRLKELRIELFHWLEQNVRLKEELRRRLSLLCNMQEDISRVSKASSESEQAEISPLRAAKFLGEIRNMQQENNKLADELQTGLNHVRRLQMDAEKLSKRRGLTEVSGVKGHRYHHVRYSTSRSKIPLRSFIFGVKTKKSASVSSTMPQNANTSLHQQRSSG